MLTSHRARPLTLPIEVQLAQVQPEAQSNDALYAVIAYARQDVLKTESVWLLKYTLAAHCKANLLTIISALHNKLRQRRSAKRLHDSSRRVAHNCDQQGRARTPTRIQKRLLL